jgi:uncharacterized protein YgiM (DUF1202 family)
MRDRFIIALLIVLVLPYPSISETQEDIGVDLAGVKMAMVNIRQEPDIKSSIILKATKESVLVLIKRESLYGWYNVIDVESGQEGWINEKYVNIKYTTNKKKANLFTPEKIESISTPEIAIKNDSYKDIRLKVGSNVYNISAHSEINITHPIGTFEYYASAPLVLPSFGAQTFEAGYRYSWRFWIESRVGVGIGKRNKRR